MLNLDMSAYVQPGTNFTMGWVSDLTSPVLTAFGKEIAETYGEIDPLRLRKWLISTSLWISERHGMSFDVRPYV